MNNINKKLLRLFVLLSLGALAFLQLNLARGDVNSALVYLKTKSPNPWITMALVAAGESPDVDYLKSTTGASATDYEAPILALAAAGKNARNGCKKHHPQQPEC